MIRRWLPLVFCMLLLISCNGRIDREALVRRNSVHITSIDTLGSLTVGNGGFAVTVDATGMQTWPEIYSNGIPLGTMSHWGWHSFPNTHGYTLDDCLEPHNLGRGRDELYACQTNAEAAHYVRSNPHRLHLGCIGFQDLDPADVTGINQTLDLWNGVIRSSFKYRESDVKVTTAVSPNADMVGFSISTKARIPMVIRFPYPTGAHTDDACNWHQDSRHSTRIISMDFNRSRDMGHALIKRTVDSTEYYVDLFFGGTTEPWVSGNTVLLQPIDDFCVLTAAFSPSGTVKAEHPYQIEKASAAWWHNYWKKGAAVDLSRCTDARAAELERRIVLSQYLTAVQCAAPTPPQETGLTYNSWFGKFHMEMIWWHQAHFALWGHPDMLERTMPWYHESAPKALDIARRQGFDGIRWMKMTDPSGMDTPSDIGTYLIWQQPHIIYLAELLRRAGRDVSQYAGLIDSTALFMTDFAVMDRTGRYVLRGCIPAQETLKPDVTVNPPFELAYWKYGLNTARRWRISSGRKPDARTDDVLTGLSPLASLDGVYLAAESAPDTWQSTDLTSDHPAMLGAYGMLPATDLVNPEVMNATLTKVLEEWHWERTWGWDFPLTAMCATRLGRPDAAIDALLMDVPTNTYLVNGHIWQNSSLRCYLPGNGGLLTAVAMMCAGYDGCQQKNPGFPNDGRWRIRWEGLLPLP